jgi:hypothetical protein
MQKGVGSRPTLVEGDDIMDWERARREVHSGDRQARIDASKALASRQVQELV